MDEAMVREAAETHAQATVERDYETAGCYLTEGMRASAGEVMREMPRPLTSAEVVSVEAGSDPVTCLIRYAGDEAETIVASRWREIEGEPRIVGLEVVEKT